MFTGKRNIGDPDAILFIVLIVWKQKKNTVII